jgi:drug/metabolite transporter (DMT)-like permease
MPALNLSSLIPLAVVALVVYLLHRHQGVRLWHAIVCLVAGVILAGSVVGPDISNVLSQITGGRLP